jgi:hypothetical protein
MGLIKKLENGVHLDHVAAQDRVQDTKIAMEHWMAKYSPNVHVDLLAETDK